MTGGKRAAVYARYSSDRQSDRSIDDQLALCRAFIERNGWTLAAVYADYEISAATVHRPELTRLMADAAAKAFDVLVAEDTDRLARGEGDMPQLRRRLEFAGVELHTCTDGHVTKLVAGFKGLMNSLFLDNLAAHVHRSLAGVVRDGRHAGGRAYGYRTVPGQPGALAIEEREAEVLRRIFSDYAAGQTPRQIAATLNGESVPPPRGIRWNASTLNGNRTRGHGILINPIYAGRIVWNRVRMVKDPATGRRVSRANPSDQHQSADAPHLRIVEPPLFDRVQEIKFARGIAGATKARRPKRLLSGLLRCGQCGGGFSARGADKTGKPRLECSTRKESGACGNRRVLYSADVERVVLAGLRQRLAEPKLLAAYVAEYNAERRRLAGQKRSERAKLERRAAEVARELKRAVTAIIKGTVDPDTLSAPIAALKAERDRLALTLAQTADADNVVTLHPEAVERYRADVETLAQTLVTGSECGDSEAMTSLRRLIAEVVVHVGQGRGAAWEVEIKGRLSELIGAPVFPSDRHSGGLVVAGGGLEPPTYGL